MTMENWVSQLGTGTKRLTERFAEYPAPVQDQQFYYPYEPSLQSHGHVAATKHHYGGGGHKSNAAMSALTLLAFLFFLHILQQCLKEHMTATSTPQVMVVSAGREGGRPTAKTSNPDKTDKAGLVHDETPPAGIRSGVPSPTDSSDDRDMFLTRIATAEHTPRRIPKHNNGGFSYTNRSSMFTGFVSAMGDK